MENPILSRLSKEANCQLLYDCTGDSISRRSGRGLIRATGLNVSENQSIEIIHAGMFVLPFLKSKNLKVGLGLALIALYLNGKK